MICSKLIPNDSINKVKCSLCSNYLSYFPVSLIEEDKNMCGRCPIPERKVSFRNKAFEEIAQQVQFPCRFKKHGCDCEMCPKDVPSHENNCNFKIFECPGKDLTSCCWKGFYNNMLTHCHDSHQDEFLQNNEFEVILKDDSGESRKLLEYDEKLFIVCITNDVSSSKTLSFMMYHVEEAINLKNYSYQVVFTRDKFTFTVTSVTTSFSEKKLEKIPLDSLLKNNISEKTPIVGTIAFEKNIIGRELNETLLSSLACSCSNYIQNCHTYQEKICKCKIEQSDMTKIVEMLDYPCHYKSKGCSVVLKSEKMKKHLLRCPFKDEICHFCEWKGLNKNFKDHIFEAHQEVTVESSEMISAAYNNYNTQNRIIRYGNHLFKLHYYIVSSNVAPNTGLPYTAAPSNIVNTLSNIINWNVSHIISTPEDRFQYEVEIINTEYNLRLKRCDQNNLCQLKNFGVYSITGNDIKFKINIYEN